MKKNRIGLRYGKLTVIAEVEAGPDGKFQWLCKCDCGNEKIAKGNGLGNGGTTSCGCLWGGRTTHGLTRTPISHAWKHMLERCYKPHHPKFPRYGGRGILVCECLRASVVNLFLLVGNRPTPDHSIDRPNNDGMYSCGTCAECLQKGWPLNVKWSTRKEQQRNRACCRMLTVNGETKCLTEWAEQTGINFHTLSYREKRGLPLFTKP